MIQYKKFSEITASLKLIESTNFRYASFDIYRKLLKSFDFKDLLLLESLGLSSVDSKTSLIGIGLALKIEVFDLDVVIQGNESLLKRVRMLLDEMQAFDSSNQLLKYRLVERKSVWKFLRLLEKKLKLVDGQVLAFATFAYNTIYFIEDIPGYIKSDMPDISLSCYSTYIEFMEEQVVLHEYGYIGVKPIGSALILSNLDLQEDHLIGGPESMPFSVNRETAKDKYLGKAVRALKHVQAGDVYQIQIGQKISIQSEVSSLDVYARLRSMNPSPYMYLFSSEPYTVLGASPESFICIKNSELRMRPIAGTIGKVNGITKEGAEDDFRTNAKEIAEHMMLVDLCRNDVCRVSVPQTLHVSELMSVEEYSHVYHMLSTVTASVRPECDKYDVIQASFPAGTMTGTPKIRAVELISEIEDSARGLYAGAIGMIGLGSDYVNTALCIRTAIECNGIYVLRASAGIVSDSSAEAEFTETLHKIGSIFKAITNEEISCHLK